MDGFSHALVIFMRVAAVGILLTVGETSNKGFLKKHGPQAR